MNNSVKKRETFYLGGYDPRGARYYYNLYKNEISSSRNNIEFNVWSRKKENTHIKSIFIEAKSIDNTLKTETNYYFLEWDDIIRKTWSPHILIFIMQFFTYLKTYVFSKFILKTFKL